MKKKLSMLMVLLLTASCLPLSASASDSAEFDRVYYEFYERYINDNYTVETEQFKYSTNEHGMTLEADLLSDANCPFMITGVYYRNEGDTEPFFYSVTPIKWGDRGNVIASSNIEPFLNQKLKIGDLIDVQELYMACMFLGPYYFRNESWENTRADNVTYLGNGMDMFGDEFAKVIRHELVSEQREYKNDISGIDTVMGDLTEDEDVSIMDVIKLNKAIFGKEVLYGYPRLMADVNKDGVVDSTDSLDIMKYIVGLKETLG